MSTGQPSQVERDLQTIRAGGSVPVGGGNIIRRGSDNRIYLVTPGARGERFSITSSVGLNAARAANALTPLNETQARQVIIQSRQPIPPGVVSPPARATPTRQERPSRRETGTGRPAANSSASSANTAPAPSTQQQPVLELNVNRDDRIRTTGPSISQRFDINSFRSEMLLNDVLPSHSYLVTFAPFRQNFSENVPLTSFVSEKRNTLMLRCENIVLPSPSLLEEENVRRYGYGPVEKIPYGVQFGDVTMTWVVDKNSEIIDFFHQWMNTIVMHDSKNASIGPGVTRNGLSKYRPFEVGYKDGYTNPIVRVYVYNRQQETVTEYEMYDVFPMNIQAMNLSWADENQVQKLTVTFAYTNMSMGAPQKTPTQFNFYETLIDAVSPYEHFEYTDSLQKFADEAASPNGESIRRTVNASRPNATEPVQPPPISADLEGLPTVRDFTNIA